MTISSTKMFKKCSKLVLLMSIYLALSILSLTVGQNLPDELNVIAQKLTVAKERLAYDQKSLDETRKQVENLDAFLANTTIDIDYLYDARLNQAKADANLQSIRIGLVEASQSVITIESALVALGDNLQEATLAPSLDEPIRIQIQKLKDDLAARQKILALEQDRVRVLNKTLQVAREQLHLQDIWLKALKAKIMQQDEAAELEQLEKQQLQLEAEQHQWLVKLSQLNKQTSDLETQITKETDEEKKKNLIKELDNLRVLRVEADERSNLTQVALLLLVNKQQITLISKQQETTSVYQLRNSLNKINVILNELSKLKTLHQRKLDLLKLRQEIADEQLAKKEDSATRQQQKYIVYNNIRQDYLAQDKLTDDMITQVKDYQMRYKQQLGKALSRRQQLPSFSAAAWESLAKKTAELPGMTVNALESLKTQLLLSMKNLTTWKLGWLLALQALLFGLWLEGRTILSKLAAKIKEKRTTLRGETLYVFVELLRRNWLTILLIAAFFSWFVFSEVPFKSYAILLWLFMVWGAFKLGIGLARLTLLEGTMQTTGYDVKLYRGLKWSMMLGGIVATCTMLAHQLPVTYEVSDFFNRILMIFFVGLGVFLLFKLRILPILLAPHLEKSRPYVRYLIKILSFLIPLAMLSNAIIGLLGYIQLAWTISKYEMVFVMIFTMYILARGILIDTMNNLASYIIRNLRNGWLWTEAILKPLDMLLRIILLVLAVWSLVRMYGWHENQYLMGLIDRFFKLQLFNVGDSPITPLTLIQIFIIGVIVYWIARWSKEFAYRWLFARTRDVGLRNSLAALFQYFMVAIVIYIGLQVLKIDWTGLKFLLVAFAAGIGFGLRDTANNLMSGLLLLFERPVQRGDIVTIGGHEGEVVHIGIRSLILQTWDHMDVLVPNSEIYSKSFINWTRQDPIIRTTIKIKVQRDDDPRRVRALIEQTLIASPDVLSDPESEVLFTDVSDDLIEIEVRYHINLQHSTSRVKVRSDLLFAIWKQFKEAGIRAPYPQQDIYVRTLPNHLRGSGKPYDFLTST